MNILKQARKGARFLIEAIDGGETCLCCGKEARALPLCPDCKKNLLTIDFSAKSHGRCKKCGKILLSELEICRECRENERILYVDYRFPIFPYRNWKKNLLFEWKMAENRTLSPFFADCIATVLQKNGWQSFPVVPIPPRPWKIHKKGWDQIDELAHFLHSEHAVAILKLLVRTTAAEQKRLSATARFENSAGGYALRHNFERLFQKCGCPKTAVLLDDITTTGATLDACAKLLKRAGVQRVIAVTLFSAR